MGTMALTPLRAIPTLLLCLLWGVSHALDSEPYEPDPPDRAARLSYVEGEVSMQPAGEKDWAPAIVNRPLTTGDKLWAERDARAEIQVGPAAVRLGSSTGFSFLNVDDYTIQMRVTAGVLNVNVRTLGEGEQIEIDTPNVALTLLRAGNYRVEVDDAGDHTVVKVSEGAVQATGPSQDVVVHAQQVVTFEGVDELVARYGTLGAPDEFDSWSLERDRREERVASSRTSEYVSPDVTGYEDLEDNGTWSSEAEYGYVWTPTHVAVGWAPYSYGSWAWVSPWGWTWIDDARWGYAPFHYGRWAHVRNRWCWVPGPRHVRAVYAPALVGWGGSPGHNVSWFPLGPREVYVPGRNFSRRYWERVNTSNTYVSRANFSQSVVNRVKDITYRNRAVPGGITAMPRTAFTSAGRTSDHRGRFNQQELASNAPSAEPPRIAPVSESRLGGPRRQNGRMPPATLATRQVVVRRDPPPAAARYARRPTPAASLTQTQPEHAARLPARGQVSDRPDRNREDRPVRVERPNVERPNNDSAPAPRSSVFEPNSIADRVRVDRDRQVRERQQREDSQQREVAARQQWQRTEDQVRQQRDQRAARESQQQQQQQQQQERERPQRAQDAMRQAAERQAEHRQVEQRQVEQRQVEQRQRPEHHERSEPPRVERPQAQRPQAERPAHSEAQRPAESKPQPREQRDGNSRSKRD
jgi:hypothetical protein